MTSAAFLDLGDRLDEVRVLRGLDSGREGVEPPNSRLVGAATRACLVLLCAHLEGYLEDVMTETLDALVSHGPRVETLPVLLRAVHAEQHLVKIESMKDRNSRAAWIQKMFSSEGALWVDGNVLDATMVRQRAVCAEMANPGSREVRQFLSLVDVDIEGYLNSKGNQALLGSVNGLVARRNAIAHGEVTTSATSGDVDGYVSAVEALAGEVDAALAQAVKDICRSGTLPW